MYLRHQFFSAVVILSLLNFGCSKKEGSQSASSSAQPQQAVAKVDPRAQFDQMFTKPELVKLGENIYQTKGMQTCLQCHRSGGEGEGFAGAAKLIAPNTFRSFNALGGYDALAKNPKEFREKLETSLLYLIHGGGLNFNKNFTQDHPEIIYDWSKTGKTQYDMMMWGVAQAEMKVKVKKVHEELSASGKNLSDEDMQWLAAYATLEYIKAFEKPGKLAEGKPAPKIWE